MRELALPLFPEQMLKNDENYLKEIDRIVDYSWPESNGKYIITAEDIFIEVHNQKSL